MFHMVAAGRSLYRFRVILRLQSPPPHRYYTLTVPIPYRSPSTPASTRHGARAQFPRWRPRRRATRAGRRCVAYFRYISNSRASRVKRDFRFHRLFQYESDVSFGTIALRFTFQPPPYVGWPRSSPIRRVYEGVVYTRLWTVP